MAGDLLALDYSEAIILAHDAWQQNVGGLPLGCFLLATRMQANSEKDAASEQSALILLRVLGRASLPNELETASHRMEAGFRAADTGKTWDSDTTSDQFTLNRLRHSGMRCNVLGTFRMEKENERWQLSFGSDISNFYSGQGMKVYKLRGEALRRIVNFTKIPGDTHSLAGRPVLIGRLRYSSSEIEINADGDNVPVFMEPTDLLARRTALFGMSRSGKSNTIKTIAASIFKLREIDPKKGRIGQLIFDVNGEYCNDNPQDRGCLRNVGRRISDGEREDVVTYGLHPHPNDKNRRLMKINFFGEEPEDWNDLEKVKASMALMIEGKEIINEHLNASGESAWYVKSFIDSHVEPSTDDWNGGARTRYKRQVLVYRTLLAKAGFKPPKGLRRATIRSLFNEKLRDAISDSGYPSTAKTLSEDAVSWDELYLALSDLGEFIGVQKKRGHKAFKKFDNEYQGDGGRSWADETLRGLLSLMTGPAGIARLRKLIDRHSADVSDDYSVQIVEELIKGKLVIVDQSVGAPMEMKIVCERIMWKLFNHQKEKFINPRYEDGNIKPPPDVIAYVEEAHNLLPSQSADLESIWARVAKEGSKFRIGMVFSTQEPSSILSNILKNTDNWFVAHLNNQDETKEMKKYYDFEMYVSQILKVPDTGFLRMRCLSNPYIVPVQVNRFEAPADTKHDEQEPQGEGLFASDDGGQTGTTGSQR